MRVLAVVSVVMLAHRLVLWLGCAWVVAILVACGAKPPPPPAPPVEPEAPAAVTAPAAPARVDFEVGESPRSLVVANGTHSEKERTITRVELATGATHVLARDLENSDDLVSDGAFLYTYSWPSTVLRIAKDTGATEVLASDLKSPTHIAVDADAVYVVSRDQNKIVRLPKRR